ncbi:SAM-dependent methyltransferase [Paenibacillus sp. KS1]|uniref:putative RNA methyltransferase n=1 Tax=Paenibacillus sp. KS1 TaxID=1849249 RepID=UPI000806690C|nr:methyltransferase domain-containing protein [Paenibacillus sp. KS1]OBY76769.1 SAM-dependent methyltransferase [Paenibacillus sp. KS1]
MTKSQKIKSAGMFSEYAVAFRCPYCEGSLKVVDLKSLECPKNHTFDIAKQGYVNLMTRSLNSNYAKELFEARQEIIRGSCLYAPLHDSISKVIESHREISGNPLLILDAGCGEGSHLQSILDMNGDAAGIGLDISKEGIVMAAKNYKDPIWLVGDLAKSPLGGQSVHVILNLFSPSNYKEFRRTLKPNGLVIKVVPRSNYLIELREAFFDDAHKKSFNNEDTVSLFKNHFHHSDVISFCYTKSLTKDELGYLVQMSPLAWTSDQVRREALVGRGSADITIDIDILIGLNK